MYQSAWPLVKVFAMSVIFSLCIFDLMMASFICISMSLDPYIEISRVKLQQVTTLNNSKTSLIGRFFILCFLYPCDILYYVLCSGSLVIFGIMF